MSYDPLSGTPSSSSYPTSQHPSTFPNSSSGSAGQVRNISPLAPRSPLPGQERGYRPQPLPPPPSVSHWGGATSPGREQQGPPPPEHARAPSCQQQQRAGPGMQPKSAQTFSESRRGEEEDGEGEGRRPNGNGNGTATTTTTTTATRAEPFVWIRVVGLEKNRRDVWVKFNAEVSRLAAPARGVERARADALASCIAAVQPPEL